LERKIIFRLSRDVAGAQWIKKGFQVDIEVYLKNYQSKKIQSFYIFLGVAEGFWTKFEAQLAQPC
jgi:hypothetical protein